jgi:SAM-dependent methyltransferase
VPISPWPRLTKRKRIDFDALSDADFVVGAYRYLYGCEPDDAGFQLHVENLRNGTRTRETLISDLRGFDDWWLQRILDSNVAVHLSRKLWVQQLPRAARILDLGGTSQDSADGALVRLGYPYPFELLTIVDLPADARQDLYAVVHPIERTVTSGGPVEYVSGSMTDLSAFPSDSVDLVFIGQAIEHVTPDDADVALAEARRVLTPNGSLCLDTPNRAATRFLTDGSDVDVINPDHKIEYTHAELSKKIVDAGFVIDAARGLNFLPNAFETGRLEEAEIARNLGVFADLEKCFILAYICRPTT